MTCWPISIPRPDPHLRWLAGDALRALLPREPTGVTGFNLALQNGRPEDAWAFTDYVRRLFPGARPRLLWFVHVEAFRRQGLSLGLIEDQRFARAFPKALIRGANERRPTRGSAIRAEELGATSFGPDGVVFKNRYDRGRRRGIRSTRGMDVVHREVSGEVRGSAPALDSRAALYFEKTVALANRLGRRPRHRAHAERIPGMLGGDQGIGWQERHDRWSRYLDGVVPQARASGSIDLSELSSVPGASGTAYYDGIHVQRVNARRILDEVVRRGRETNSVSRARQAGRVRLPRQLPDRRPSSARRSASSKSS